MSDYGFKAALPGYDVKTASDNQLGFSSKFKTLKVFEYGRKSIVTDGNGNGGYSFAHNLGFVPSFQAFRYTSGNSPLTVTASPAQSSDDCSVNPSTKQIFLTDTIIRDSNSYDLGIRFSSLGIQPTSKIRSAYITLYAASNQSGAITITIYGEKSGTPGTFTDGNNYYSKTLTSNSVQWAIPSITQHSTYNTSDLSAIVQEIVNLPDFAYGNPMLFEFRGGSSYLREWFAWDNGSMYAVLTVIFDSSPQNTTPYSYMPNPNNPSQALDNFLWSVVKTDATYINMNLYGACPNFTYDFKYYIFSDLSEIYSGNVPAGSGNIGMKTVQNGYDVKTAQLYNLGYTTRFPPLKFDPALSGTGSFSLPAISSGSQYVGVDIFHDLGYSPFFLLFYKTDYVNPTWELEVPDYRLDSVDNLYFNIYSFCNTLKVRIEAYRTVTSVITSLPLENITFKYYIFHDNLDL